MPNKTFHATVTGIGQSRRLILFWKKPYPYMEVRFSDEEFRQLRRIMEKIGDWETDDIRIPEQEIRITFNTEELPPTLSIGEEVEVDCEIDSPEPWSEPFRLLNVRKSELVPA